MVTQIRRRRRPSEALRASVREADQPQTMLPLLWLVGNVDDGMIPYGSVNPKPRDKQLRDFYPTESYLASAVSTVAVRNGASEWNVEAPARTKRIVLDMLHGINDGRGLEDLAASTSIDLSTQDSGAFIELERMRNSDTAPVITMNHLDAARCYITSDPDYPVLYQNQKGRWHKIRWYNVLHLREVPDPKSDFLQMCAVTRALRLSKILKSFFTYTDEKISGRFTSAIHLVQGATTDQLNEAMDRAQLTNDAQGLLRYAVPVIFGSINPKSSLDLKTIEMASLPDKFNQEEWMKWYIAGLAMAFLTDYQEFAPLPGGNLGTASQSEVLHMKTRGKGPAWFRRIMSNAINYRGVIPQNAIFHYDEQDVEEDIQHANLRLIRAQARQTDVQSGVLSPDAARRQAVLDGDIDEAVAGMVSITPEGALPVQALEAGKQDQTAHQPQDPADRPSELNDNDQDKILRRAIEGAPRGRTR